MNRLNYMMANIKLAALHLDLISATCLTLFLTPSPPFCHLLHLVILHLILLIFQMFCTDLLPKWPTAKHRWSLQKWSDQYPDRENMFPQLSCIHLKRRLRRRAARLKCALAGFFEEQPILQHFTTILILQLSKTVDSKLQFMFQQIVPFDPFERIPFHLYLLYLALWCWHKIGCVSAALHLSELFAGRVSTAQGFATRRWCARWLRRASGYHRAFSPLCRLTAHPL